MLNRVGALSLPHEEPRPFELGRGRRRSLTAGAHHLIKERERGALLLETSARPRRDPARDEQDVRPSCPRARVETARRARERGDRARRVSARNEQEGAPELRKRVASYLLQQRERLRAFGGIPPVPRIRPGGLKQLLRPFESPPIEGDPPGDRQAFDARVVRQRYFGAVHVSRSDARPRQSPRQTRAIFRGQLAVARQLTGGLLELAPVDQRFDHGALGELLDIGGRARVAG